MAWRRLGTLGGSGYALPCCLVVCLRGLLYCPGQSWNAARRFVGGGACCPACMVVWTNTVRGGAYVLQNATRLAAHPSLPFFASGGVGSVVALWRSDDRTAATEYHQQLPLGAVCRPPHPPLPPLTSCVGCRRCVPNLPPAGHAVSVAPSQRVTRVRFNQQGLSLAACDDSGGLWVWQVLRPDVVSHSLRVKACLGHVALWPSLITGLHAVPRETSLRHRVPQLSLPRCHGWRGCLCTVRCSRCRAMVAALTCLPTRRAVRQAHFVGPV